MFEEKKQRLKEYQKNYQKTYHETRSLNTINRIILIITRTNKTVF